MRKGFAAGFNQFWGIDKLTYEIEKTPVIPVTSDHCIFPRRKGAQSN